jgi:Gti1/Pac2 family transcription factor
MDSEHGNDSPGWKSPSWPSPQIESIHGANTSPTSSSLSSSSYRAQSPPVGLRRAPQVENVNNDSRYSLPRLSMVAPPHHLSPQPHSPRSMGASGNSYSPLTPEDRKALNSFRVVL